MLEKNVAEPDVSMLCDGDRVSIANFNSAIYLASTREAGYGCSVNLVDQVSQQQWLMTILDSVLMQSIDYGWIARVASA